MTDVAQVVDEQRNRWQHGGGHQQRRPSSGPPESVRAERGGDDDVGRPVARDQAQHQTCRDDSARRARPGEQKKRGDDQQLTNPVLPQGLTADHPRGRAECVRERQQQRGPRASSPAQQQIEERDRRRRHERRGDLFHDSRDSVELLRIPAGRVEIRHCGQVQRRHEHRHDQRVERNGMTSAKLNDPVGRVGVDGRTRLPARAYRNPTLRGEFHDWIQEHGVPVPDREGKIARRVGITAADRSEVGGIHEQAEKPDDEAGA